VLTITRSPAATGPIRPVSAYARRPLSSSTRCRPSRSLRIVATRAVANAGTSGPLERGDELLDPLVARLERVLAEHGALGLVDELVLDDPVALAVELHRIVLELGQAVLPHQERLLLERAEALLLVVALGPLQVLSLDVEGARLAAVGQSHPSLARRVVGDLPD